MLQIGVPKGAVKDKILRDGYDEYVFSTFFESDGLDLMHIDKKPHTIPSVYMKPKVPAKNENTLLALINIMSAVNKLASSEVNQLLKEFMDEFNSIKLMEIIFSGLASIKTDNKKNEYISFFTNNISNIMSQQEEKQFEQQTNSSHNILDLHLDSLTYICKFLNINELLQFEQCNRYLFKIIRDNPQCIVSLTDVSLDKYWSNYDTIPYFKRFSCVKKLLYPYKTTKEHWKWIRNILPNITELLVRTIDYGSRSLSDNLHLLRSLKSFGFKRNFNEIHSGYY